MAGWIFRREQGCCLKAICPHAMRSFWKLAALRLTDSIRIQSGRRALRCFRNDLHHFYQFKSEVVLTSRPNTRSWRWSQQGFKGGRQRTGKKMSVRHFDGSGSEPGSVT